MPQSLSEPITEPPKLSTRQQKRKESDARRLAAGKPMSAGFSDPQEDRRRNSTHYASGRGGGVDGVDGVDVDVVTRGAKIEPQMRTLLRLYDEGLLAPEPVAGLGELHPGASKGERLAFDLIKLRFGLRMADGTTEPMPLAASELVNAGIVATPGGASKLLQRFERLEIIWSPGDMPKLGKGNGTRLFLPGPKPRNPFRPPLGGWCAGSAVPAGPGCTFQSTGKSDGVPDAVFEGAAVPVEAEDVGAAAVEPAVEAPDQPGMADAVWGGSARPLDRVQAVGGGADLRWRGHGREAYGRTTTAPTGADLLHLALAKAKPGNRNATGFWLACQLRDHGMSVEQAHAMVQAFSWGVPAGDHPYAGREASASVVQAYRRSPREPWV